MIHIPARTPSLWYHYSREAPLWKPLKCPQNFPHSSGVKLALAVGWAAKNNPPRRLAGPDDICLHRNPRWQVVGGQRLDLERIMWPQGRGRAQEWVGEKKRGRLSRKGSCSNGKENPPLWERAREGMQSLLSPVSAIHYHSFGNINMPFAIELKSLCH